MAEKKQNNSSESTTSREASTPSPKNKPENFSHSRPLTPSELKDLKEDSVRSAKVLKGMFKDLA